ncbi:MAG: DUF4129 domain-containing protein [Bacteroidetes bacterium]|nr:DUF4129 domain-containing protein [Bacteroidota bacterium]
MAFVLLAGLVFGQQVQEEYYRTDIRTQKFEKDKWEKATEGINYSGEVVSKKKQKEVELDEDGRPSGRDQTQPSLQFGSISKFWLTFFKVLAIVLLIFILALILKSILGENTPKNKKISKQSNVEINIENIEENLEEADVVSFLDKAIAEKKFGMAIRLYYLSIIKELSSRNVIRWEKEKTNRDYWIEVKNKPFSKAFSEVTSIFEYVWYGKKQVDKAQFEKIQPKFQQLMQTIEGEK